MGQRIVRRYSACFKQQVVAELESGRFDSIHLPHMSPAARHRATSFCLNVTPASPIATACKGAFASGTSLVRPYLLTCL